MNNCYTLEMILGLYHLYWALRIGLGYLLGYIISTLYELESALAELPASRPPYQNIRTLLSAAMTNQNACIDGFLDVENGRYLENLLTPVSQMISNVLALIKHVEGQESVKNVRMVTGEAAPRRRRRRRKRKRRLRANVVGEGGVYRENVVIPREKINIMLVGEGMNSTIITASRSLADGFSTFESATLSICGGRQVHSRRHHHTEHSSSGETPSRGATQDLERSVLPLQHRLPPGNPLCAPAAPALPRVHDSGDDRLHLRERGRGVQQVQDTGAEAAAGAEEHHHGAGEGGSEPEHRDQPAQVHDRGRGRVQLNGEEAFHDVPREAVEEVLEGVRCEQLPRRPDTPSRVAGVASVKRCGYCEVRRVQELRTRCIYEAADLVGWLPEQLHRRDGEAV
ncbi:hypothetical protein SASPL_109704 [Salvia splendens]|uniref:Pectinesterase inhibitor domain-containing protein n=1 Tax=Salvia splendens TaxID=180675 RepID=A0A8X8YEQ5_SALSN|nr:hypothetical protein SASPL_109704 [Salvia splendens]